MVFLARNLEIRGIVSVDKNGTLILVQFLVVSDPLDVRLKEEIEMCNQNLIFCVYGLFVFVGLCKF